MSNPFKSSKNTRFEKPESDAILGSDTKSEKEPQVKHRHESRPRVERNYDIRPSFVFKSSKPTQKIYYEHNNEDFPDLVVTSSDLNNQCTLDYKNASLKEEEKPEEVEVYEPGWLYMKLDKSSNTILKKTGPKIISNSKPLVSPQQQLNISMNNIIQKMEERRIRFIETYGEDNYERDYRTDSYYEMAEDYDEEQYYSDDDYMVY